MPRVSRKVAAPRGGISANCPSASPKRSGGNPGEFRRQQQHRQQLAGQVFALRQRGATGKPGSRHRRARRAAGEQTKRGKEAPRREKGPIPRAPRPPANPVRPRGLRAGRGALPAGIGWGGLAGGPRKRKFALLLLLPPASATEKPASPHPPRPGLTPCGSQGQQQQPPPCAPRAVPRPLTCWAGRRPAPSPPGAAHPPRTFAPPQGVPGLREGSAEKTSACPSALPAPVLTAPAAAAFSPRAQLTPGGPRPAPAPAARSRSPGPPRAGGGREPRRPRAVWRPCPPSPVPGRAALEAEGRGAVASLLPPNKSSPAGQVPQLPFLRSRQAEQAPGMCRLYVSFSASPQPLGHTCHSAACSLLTPLMPPVPSLSWAPRSPRPSPPDAVLSTALQSVSTTAARPVLS
ncbi:basic proline-rich protein-like [Passer domesticus]|uniref:basic proline-rich protein-like n=1 Tax=Passer domesticus TaxID=48849 RepID=UPI0030FE04D9